MTSGQKAGEPRRAARPLSRIAALSAIVELRPDRAEAKPRRAVYDGEYLANGFKPAEGDAELVLPEIFLNLIDDEPQDHTGSAG